ncbi:hypothetical protein CL614_02160 [archaeon]|nr:hypothetical protein [archaeon]|tara:strand:- start:684 stop:1085 length:402 start_codon:yes stop_codon:yes gene_type:complete
MGLMVSLVILIDTNMLLAQIQFNANIIKQLKREDKELVVLTPVLIEIERLAIGRTEDAMAARVAIEVIAKERLRIIEVELKHGDNAIVEYAKLVKSDDMRIAVATNDKALINRLVSKKIPVYRLKQKKLIEKV